MVEYLVVPQYFISASFINATLQIHQNHVSEIPDGLQEKYYNPQQKQKHERINFHETKTKKEDGNVIEA